MLTFTVYHLLKNPNSLIKLRQEVDHVVGTGDIQLEHLDKMPYLVGMFFGTLFRTVINTNGFSIQL